MVITAVTAPVAGFDFVLHDDTHEILSNRNYYPFDTAALRRIWTEHDFSRIYIPVNYTILGILASLSRWWHHLGPLARPAPDIFHIAGIILHLLNSWLVFRLLRPLAGEKTGETFPAVSLTAALIFALHPVQVESYARAGNITVTLGGTFSLLCLQMFIAGHIGLRGGRIKYAAATALFCLALLTRPSAAMLPAAVFFLAWAVDAAPPKALVLRLLPWLLISAVYTLMTMSFQQTAIGPQVSFLSRILISADSLLWYAAQTIWPATLSVDHGRTPEMVLSSRTAWLSLAGLAAFLTVLLLAFRKDTRVPVGGCLFFLLLLIPASGLIPSPNRESMSIVYDRHLYLPLAGLCMVLAACSTRLPEGWLMRLGVPLVCLLALFSRRYQQVWANSTSLFQHVVTVNPQSWYGHSQLGTSLLLSGFPAEASGFLSKAVMLKPELADARINLGQALLETGRPAEAEAELRAALAQDKLQDNAHNNLSVALLRRQAYGEAEAEAREALRLNPLHPMAGVNLALALSGQGKFKEATPLVRQAVREYPGTPHAWRALAEVLFQAGQRDEGIHALAQACGMAPGQQDWHRLLESRVKDAEAAKSGSSPAVP